MRGKALQALIACIALAPLANASEPVTITVTNFVNDRGSLRVTVRAESNVARLINMAFYRCTFFNGDQAVVSQLGIVSNIQPGRPSFHTLSVPRERANAVSCVFERLSYEDGR